MKYYTRAEIERMYAQESPGQCAELIREKARMLHSQLNTLDVGWRRSNRRFYRMNELDPLL